MPEKSEPEWIVNDNGELGVVVEGRAYFLYKGASLEYDDGSPIRYRPVGKREFGECCKPVSVIENRCQLAWDTSLDACEREEIRNSLTGHRYLDGPAQFWQLLSTLPNPWKPNEN